MATGEYVSSINSYLYQAAPAFFKDNEKALEPLRESIVKRLNLPKELQDLRLDCSSDIKYQSKYSGVFRLSVGGTQGHPLARFTLDLYPDCCALHQLNGFGFYPDLDRYTIDAFINVCIGSWGKILTNPKRLMINFVETTREDALRPEDVVPVHEHQKMNYQSFYDWAMSKPHLEQMFVNHNTSRVIHNVIVTL